MAEEFHGGPWWDTPRGRYDPGTAASSSSSSSSSLTSLRGFSWLGDASGGRSSMESASVSGGGPVSFLDPPKMRVQGHGSSVLGEGGGGGGGGGVAVADASLHMMNLCLSSQPMDWDAQNLMSGDKSGTGFRAMLQENLNMNAAPDGQSSRHQIQSGLQVESPPIYGASPPSSLFQGILGSENQSPTVSYQYSPTYCQNSGELFPSWSKVPQFLMTSPSKHQQQQQQPTAASHNQLHFSNNTPFWNATSGSLAASNIRTTSCYFPSPQSSQSSTSSFDEKAENLPEATSNVTSSAPAAATKKSGGETAGGKRTRGGGAETGTPLPPFKVRKEKMGDRITALQQLVSPFGKTDTASVLTEAIDYIKFLHEQVSILSAPYMKSGEVLQHHQDMEECEDPGVQTQDLRTRGLCLVPVSSTFPVADETAVDFWNPTFGGTYR
ncbi:hypothetical protein MLD38_027115 [Melastoma candidum]|uniref:Uncharacterized protein n=1 Tax=Melastoma candidum TaxID=119954 RepID=A0ACB9P163_9MYRT|nr:hypothetical protein MLD38_027115 [Melastoma candidum]